MKYNIIITDAANTAEVVTLRQTKSPDALIEQPGYYKRLLRERSA